MRANNRLSALAVATALAASGVAPAAAQGIVVASPMSREERAAADGYYVLLPIKGAGGEEVLTALNGRLAPCGLSVQFDAPAEDFGVPSLAMFIDTFRTEAEAEAVADAARACVPEVGVYTFVRPADAWYVVVGTDNDEYVFGGALEDRVSAQLEPCGIEPSSYPGASCGLPIGTVGVVGALATEALANLTLEAAKLCVPGAYVIRTYCEE